MSRELTQMQQDFVERFVECGDARTAALSAGYSEMTVSSKAYQLKADLAPEIEKRVRECFADGVPVAQQTLKNIMVNGLNDASRARAADSWLDRAGFKDGNQPAETAEAPSHDELVINLFKILARGLGGKNAMIIMLALYPGIWEAVTYRMYELVDQYPEPGNWSIASVEIMQYTRVRDGKGVDPEPIKWDQSKPKTLEEKAHAHKSIKLLKQQGG